MQPDDATYAYRVECYVEGSVMTDNARRTWADALNLALRIIRRSRKFKDDDAFNEQVVLELERGNRVYGVCIVPELRNIVVEDELEQARR